MSLEETKAAHAVLIADMVKETHPGLTPGQIKNIQRDAAAVIGDWDIAPLSRVSNDIILQGLIGAQPELTRAIPTPGQVRDHLLHQHQDDFGEFVTGQKEMEIARQVAAMTEDERLAACPLSAVVAEKVEPSAVDKLNATPPVTMTAREIEDEEDRFLRRTLGLRPHEVDGRKRAEYLKHFHPAGPSFADQQNAKLIDVLNQRSGGDDEKLSTADRMAKYHAEQALKRKK